MIDDYCAPRTFQGGGLFPLELLAFLIIPFETPYDLRINGNHGQDSFTDHAGGYTFGNGLPSWVWLLRWSLALSGRVLPCPEVRGPRSKYTLLKGLRSRNATSARATEPIFRRSQSGWPGIERRRFRGTISQSCRSSNDRIRFRCLLCENGAISIVDSRLDVTACNSAVA